MSELNRLIDALCPDGVEWKKIGDISECFAGATPKTELKENWENGTISWMSSGEVNLGQVYRTEKKITKKAYDNCSTKMVPPNTVVVALAGQGKTRGQVAITKLPLCTNQSLCSIVVKDDIISEFLYYFLKTQYQELRTISSGDGTRGGLNLKMIKDYKIPIPPLPIQEEIVRILDAFTKHTAELEAELEARKKQYEHYAEKLLNNPQWKAMTILDMLSQPITDGPHETPEFVECGIPFISAEAICDNKIDLGKKRGYITKEYDELCAKKYKPKKNDVYLVKSGSTTGKVAMVEIDDDFNIWSPIAAMRVNDKNDPRFLYHLLRSSSVQEQVEQKASHGSQPNLGMRALEKFVVRVPSLNEQEDIVKILDRFNEISNDITQGLPAEIAARRKQYEYYRDKLLTFKEKVS